MESVWGAGRGGGHGDIGKGEAKRRRKGRKGGKEERRKGEQKEGEALRKGSAVPTLAAFGSESTAATLRALRAAPLVHPTACPDLSVSNS